MSSCAGLAHRDLGGNGPDIAGHRTALAERSARDTEQGSCRHGDDAGRSNGTLLRWARKRRNQPLTRMDAQ